MWPAEPVERARLAAIVDSSDDAIVSKDLTGIVTSWNRGAERLFGYTASEMIGRSIRAIIPADRQREEDAVLAAVARGDKVDHFETLRQRKDGSLVPISLTVSPIRNDDGVVIGASKIARDISDRIAADRERARLLAAAEASAALTDQLNQFGTIVASTLDRNTIVQSVTDAATRLTGAEFGAFFYNNVDRDSGENFLLYTLSGAAKEAFAALPNPRATALFAPTFRGEGTVRLDDVLQDPRYGSRQPYGGMPPGHLPVRSYLAVPVRARSGEVLGGLFFGHSATGRFTAEHERLAEGIAVWASVALENARLYASAQEANRLKDEFLATLSHELRTPLNAILGYARMMKAGLLPADRLTQALETMERNSVALTQIVEDILDVSRIIAGKTRLKLHIVALAPLLRDAVETVRPAAEAKGVSLVLDIDDAVPAVAGDTERLQQVLWNLVANAVKFTRRDGTVTVRLQGDDHEVRIVVADTGVGIPAAFLPHIFERFRQADASTTRERGGLGLGLSIARHFVELHGGTITAASEGIDKGATFTVRLPISPAVADAGRAGAERARREERTDLPRPSVVGLRVLAVDDDPVALSLVREILEANGAVVETAASAQQALELLAARRHDILLADIGMPHVDGLELIRRVRAAAASGVSDMPAAALTAYARSEDRERALESGFQAHLTKPIDPGELMAAVVALSRRS